MIASHTAMAGGQGFATNWGGFFVSLVTAPANMTAAAFLQARLVSGIAHLRGYELADPRVRTAILMVMLGPNTAASLVSKGVLPSSPLLVATAPRSSTRAPEHPGRPRAARPLPEPADGQAPRRVGRQAHIPLVGGGVGAAVDGWSTLSIARHAMHEFPNRRPKRSGSVTTA